MDYKGRVWEIELPDDDDELNWTPRQDGSPAPRAGNPTIHISYDDDQLTKTIIDQLGNKTLYQYDRFGTLVSVTKYRQTSPGVYLSYSTTTITYDSQGRIASITDPKGNTAPRNITPWQFRTDFNYNDLGLLDEIIYPGLEENGRPTKSINYDFNTGIFTVVNERGFATHETRDAMSRIIKTEIEKADWQDRSAITTVDYDGAGNKVRTVMQTYALNGDANNLESFYTFDVLGRLTGIYMPTDTYLEGGTTVTTRQTVTYEYEYTSIGLKKREVRTLAGGTIQTTEYIYDQLGREISTHTTFKTKDANGQEQTVNVDTKTYYDENGNKIKYIDPNGHEFNYTYYANNKLWTETDPGGHTTIHTYDLVGNLLSTRDPLGRITKYEYDSLYRLERTILPDDTLETDNDNPVIIISYDECGNKLTEEIRKDKSTVGKVTTYEYYPRNLVKKQTVSTEGMAGYSTEYAYDAAGNTLVITGPNNQTTYYTYDALNRQTSVTDAMGNTSKTEYDIFGNKHRTVDANGNQTLYVYNYASKLISVTNALNNTTHYYYDRMGNMTRMTRPGETTTLVTDYSYDELGRLVMVRDELGHTTEYRYDAAGNKVYAKDPNGNETFYIYDADNLLKRILVLQGLDGKCIDYSYDPAHQQTLAVQYVAHLAQAGAEPELTEESRLARTYTVLGQVASETRQAAGQAARTVIYGYDYLGNIATMLYPNAVAPLEYHYNNLGQLSRIPGFIEGLSGNPGITYNQGLPQTVRYANGVFLAYTYDWNGRLDTRTDTLGGTQLFSLNLDYDSNSNIIARTVNGKTNTYAYDNLNQLLTASIYANQAEQVRAYDYGLGQVHEDYRGDKVVEVQPEDFEVNLDYAATSLSVIFNQVAQNIQRLELTPAEANHRLTNRRYLAIYYKTSGDYQKLDPADWEFACDATTGKITVTFPDLLTAYEVKIHCLFDDRDKDYLPVKKRGATSEFANLARSMVRVYRVYERRYEDYVYDRNGNRMSETITTLYPRTYGYTYYPNSDRLKTRETSDGTTKWAFVYDNNGNLVEKGNTYTITGDTVTFTTSGEGVVYWQYEYDVFNRLVSVKKNGVTVSSYVYDPTGLRIVKQASETIVYDYDLAGNVICEKNVSNGKTYSYVWVSGRHLARVDGVIGESGAVKYFYETDHLGSPMVVTDQGGRVVWRGDFTPFGEKVTDTEAWVFVDTHGFTGKDWDEDVGLYYFNARWYDSELGRFVSEDLAEDPNNPNLYVYCINNPLRYMDPTGLLTLKGTVLTENEATLIPGDTTVIGSWGIVEQRDSYWKIAEQIYGKGKGYLGIQIARANGKDPRDPIYPGDVLYIPFMTEFETDSGKVYGYTRIDLRSFQETIKNRSIAQTEIIVDKPVTYNVVKRTKDGIWNQEVDLGPFFGIRLKSTGKSSWLEGIHYNFALTEMSIDEIQAFKARTFGLWAGLQWSLGGLRYREHGWSIPSGKWGIDNPGIGKYAIGIRGGIRIHLAEASLKIPIGPIDISLSGFLGAGITGQLGYTPGSKDFYSFSIGWGFGGGLSIGPSDRGFNIADLLFIIAPPELLNVKLK